VGPRRSLNGSRMPWDLLVALFVVVLALLQLPFVSLANVRILSPRLIRNGNGGDHGQARRDEGKQKS